MKVDVIVGGLYGDEGKGKIVSYLGEKYDYIFRVNASTNASHTVQLSEQEPLMITKQLPSVFGSNDKEFIVGPGAILNLKELRKELENRPDLDLIRGHVKIASSITLLLSLYIKRNKNSLVASKYGSTNQGTGNAVIARTSRHCVYLSDVKNVVENITTRETLKEKVKDSIETLDIEFAHTLTDLDYDKEVLELIEEYQKIQSFIGAYCVDYTAFLSQIPENSSILIEGCNGVMLDNLHGLNPYTTSCSTSVNALLNGANLSPYDLDQTYLIITGYFCCLNKRPFVTEMKEEEADKIRKHNAEVDSAEDMPRRLGWFDLPTLRKVLIGHKNATLVMNKLDAMESLKEIKICDYYELPTGEKLYYMPDDIELVKLSKPHYVKMKGWESLKGVTCYQDLPTNLIQFLKYIETEIGIEIAYVGIGRSKNALLKKEEN